MHFIAQHLKYRCSCRKQDKREKILSSLNDMHLLTGQIMSGKQALSPLDMYESYNCALNTRSVLPTRQASKFLCDSICRLDSSLCLADEHFLKLYGSYDSTTIHGVSANKTSDKISKSPNEMQKSTRQFTLSTRIMSTVLDNPLIRRVVKGHVCLKNVRLKFLNLTIHDCELFK